MIFKINFKGNDMSGIPAKVFIGEQYSRWTVLSLSEMRYAGDKGRTYLCRCECGAERIVHGKALRSGGSRSCGCGRSKPGPAKGTVPVKAVAARRVRAETKQERQAHEVNYTKQRPRHKQVPIRVGAVDVILTPREKKAIADRLAVCAGLPMKPFTPMTSETMDLRRHARLAELTR